MASLYILTAQTQGTFHTFQPKPPEIRNSEKPETASAEMTWFLELREEVTIKKQEGQINIGVDT